MPVYLLHVELPQPPALQRPCCKDRSAGVRLGANLLSACWVQVLPVLRPFLGQGKLGNWLIRNKWRSYEAVQRLRGMPILMLSAGQVRLKHQPLGSSIGQWHVLGVSIFHRKKVGLRRHCAAGGQLRCHGAAQDEIVPPSHMRALHEALGGRSSSRVAWVEFPEAHHNDTYEVAAAQYWPALLAFFRQHIPLQD